MSLIDKTYFVGELNIPGKADQSIGQRLDWFIEKYETELLEDLLGYDAYLSFTNDGAAERWTDLKNGKVYTYYTRTHKWKGLLNVDNQRSLIANYIYFHWMRDQATVTTTSGEKKTKAENSDNASASFKVIRAWNEMCEQIAQMFYFLHANPVTYPEFTYEGDGYYYNPFYWWPSYTHYGKYSKINLLGL